MDPIVIEDFILNYVIDKEQSESEKKNGKNSTDPKKFRFFWFTGLNQFQPLGNGTTG